MAVPLFTLTACSNDDDSRMQVEKRVPLTFVSQLDDQSENITRYGTDVQSTQLVSGTKVGIFLYDAKDKKSDTGATTYANGYQKKNIEFTANGSGSFSNSYSWYWPENGNGVKVFAYAPYNSAWDLSVTSNTTKDFSVPASQTDNSTYKSYDLLYGKANSGNAVTPATGQDKAVPITFSHMLSKITVNLTAGNGVALSNVTSVQVLNTVLTATVTYANNAISSATKKSNTATSTITCGGEGTSSCSAIVIPGNAITTSTVLIRVNTSGGGVFDYKPTTAVTFASGKNYTYNITLNTYGLTVTSSITNWGTQTETGSITY